MTRATRAEKARLRAMSLERRSCVDADARLAFAEKLARCIPRLLEWPSGRAVAGYWPVKGEPDCLPLLGSLAAAGYATLLPVAGRPAAPLAFRIWREGAPLVVNRFGIGEPSSGHPVEPDILFVPCAAFDRSGHRIGFGMGYYDATLAYLRARRPILAVALAFACQMVDEIPAEAHDERLDAVITERAILIASQTGKALDAAVVHW